MAEALFVKIFDKVVKKMTSLSLGDHKYYWRVVQRNSRGKIITSKPTSRPQLETREGTTFQWLGWSGVMWPDQVTMNQTLAEKKAPYKISLKKKKEKKVKSFIKLAHLSQISTDSLHYFKALHTLWLPWVTKIEFLLTISIQCQVGKWWE